MNEVNMEKSKRRGGLPWRWIVGILVVAGIVFAIVFFARGGFTDKESVGYITDQVEKHILLPDEEPTISTVENAGALTAQPFFSKVEDGDKILIFPESARILIWRPGKNILVNVGPIVDDAGTGTVDAGGDTGGEK